VSGVNPASDQKRAGLIEKETLKKRISNIEQGIMNAEGMFFVDFIKMTERSDSTIRHSTFGIRYSAVRFSGISFLMRLSKNKGSVYH
jgi:hypothetical protein